MRDETVANAKAGLVRRRINQRSSRRRREDTCNHRPGERSVDDEHLPDPLHNIKGGKASHKSEFVSSTLQG